MAVWRGVLAAGAAVAALALGPALADSAIPSQEDWAGARQSVTLPDGQTLSYVEMGPAEGVPVILIHGYSDNSRSWSLLAPYLPGRHLIAVDLRGHGGSAAPDCCYAPDSLADDIAGFLDAKQIGQADVVGHSLGSMTGAVLAATHPEKVRKLVLISTAVSVPAAALDWLWANVPALPDKIDPDSQFMLDWYANPNPVPSDFIDRERAESAAMPKQAWMGVLQGTSMTDWTPLAARIKAPTLILWGDKDGFFDAAAQERVKAALPSARHETFAGFGHNMFWEAPEKVGAMITDFLKG